jgi:hypothetical protein
MTKMREISIANDFTRFPGGRYREHGKGSGELFREDFLLPVLRAGETAVVDLDGTSGYPSSFLEEAFGGLVRAGFTPSQIRSTFRFKASPQYSVYESLIWTYVERAAGQRIATG